MNRFDQWLVTTIALFFEALGIEVVTTCRHCGERIAVDNITNHMRYFHEL